MQVVFDIETGPLPEPVLRAIYREPTFEEFAADCDQRWKPKTKAAKFEEAKTSGWQKFCDRAAISPLTGRVLAVGIRSEKLTEIIGEAGQDEADILQDFWSAYKAVKNTNGQLIGFNCASFDVPFLVRRSWLHGITVPESLYERGRYLSSTILDLMALWGQGSGDRVSLDTLARWFGIGGKPEGVNGAAFAGLWLAPETRGQAIEYLKNDLEMTWRLAERMGVVA